MLEKVKTLKVTLHGSLAATVCPPRFLVSSESRC